MQNVSERAALIPGGLSDGQFYSPPESEAGKKFIICILLSLPSLPLGT